MQIVVKTKQQYKCEYLPTHMLIRRVEIESTICDQKVHSTRPMVLYCMLRSWICYTVAHHSYANRMQPLFLSCLMLFVYFYVTYCHFMYHMLHSAAWLTFVSMLQLGCWFGLVGDLQFNYSPIKLFFFPFEQQISLVLLQFCLVYPRLIFVYPAVYCSGVYGCIPR